MQIRELKKILDEVAPTFYGAFEISEIEEVNTSLLVFQRTRSEFKTYSDDKANVKIITYQINVVARDVEALDELCTKLENRLIKEKLSYFLATEFINDNDTITSVYEIRTEEITNG